MRDQGAAAPRTWRAEIQWHEDSTAPDGLEEWRAALDQGAAEMRFDDRTRTVTATVTLEAASVLDALHLADGMTGDESWLRAIVPEMLSRQLVGD